MSRTFRIQDFRKIQASPFASTYWTTPHSQHCQYIESRLLSHLDPSLQTHSRSWWNCIVSLLALGFALKNMQWKHLKSLYNGRFMKDTYDWVIRLKKYEHSWDVQSCRSPSFSVDCFQVSCLSEWFVLQLWERNPETTCRWSTLPVPELPQYNVWVRGIAMIASRLNEPR